MICARFAAGHIVGRNPCVVLADVREECEPRDIPERPHVVGRTQALVDLDPAPRDLQSERLEPVDVRPAARRDEQPVERQLAAVT